MMWILSASGVANNRCRKIAQTYIKPTKTSAKLVAL
jgi:hypothetical protein